MNIAFILETALIFLVVFLIGAVLGYLIRCWFFKPQAVMAPLSTPAKPVKPVAQSAPVATPSVASPAPTPAAPVEAKEAKVSPVVLAPEPEAKPEPDVKPEAEAVSIDEKEPEVASTPEPIAQSKPEPVETAANSDKDDNPGKPVGLSEPRNGQKDDLKRIKGIGPKIEGTLNELGIFHFDQIAEWSPATIDWVNGFLSFKGRVQRENWIDQSKALASGGETEFSKRVDKGDVPSSKN